MNNRQLFLSHIAQTSPKPIGIEMERAEGIYLWDKDGKKYIDGIAGFSVCNIGHSNAKVVKAVQDQVAAYMHVIVYGEFIETPQVAYASLLAANLPSNLNCVYFTNSGAEATEGAMKLAKRVTRRTKIISAKNAYHGSTQGALSTMGDEYYKQSFRPLLPDTFQYAYNSEEFIQVIDNNTACVLLETVQAESGITKPTLEWLQAVRKKCEEHCVLLIFDEIQAGFGRTGSLWAFEQFDVVPDILLLGKALGGGMPLGAFIASTKLMSTLTHDPVLGHITTFGGHPVSCAAGKAALEVLLQEGWIDTVKEKAIYLKNKIQHTAILEISEAGLWISLRFASDEQTSAIANNCVQNGLITDWFLFAPNKLRIAPPLCITYEELDLLAEKLLHAIIHNS